MELDYQEIFNRIQDLLPDEWEKVVFYAEYDQGSYLMKYYVKLGTGDFTDCYDMGISPDTLDDIFETIDGMIEPEWNKLKDKWSNMTMVIDQKGEFKVDFGYESFGSEYSKFQDEWSLKYLDKERV